MTIDGWFSLGTPTAPAEVVSELQRTPGGPGGYRLRRVFLVQYWRWEYEVIDVPHGRLFLTGRNASGKTTALTAAMVLLDGSLRPERLDTSGRRSRQIADYVLLRTNASDADASGTDGSEHRLRYPQRNSYVAAEFECVDPGQLADSPRADGQSRPETVTIGMAFAGRQHGQVQVETTYFVLADGARLERDIPLLTNGDQVIAPRALFGFQFGGFPGRFYTRNLGEYQQLVAEHLFGYDDPAELEQLTEWLAHLRRPDIAQATASLAALTDRLKTALPPLAESVAEKLIEAFEQLAELRRDRARSYEQLSACQEILTSSEALGEALVRQRAWGSARAADDERKRQRNLRDHQRELARIREDVARAEADLDRSRREREQLDGQIAAIRSSASLQDHQARLEELRRRQEDQEQATRDVDGLTRQVDQTRAALDRASTQIERLAEEWVEHRAAGEGQVRALVAAAEDLTGDQHLEAGPIAALGSRLSGVDADRLEADDFRADLDELDGVAAWLQDRRRRLDQLEYLRSAWRQAREQADRLDDQLRTQRDVVDQADERQTTAENELAEAWERLDQIVDDVVGTLAAGSTVEGVRSLLDPLRAGLATRHRADFDDRVADAVAAIERLVHDLDAAAARAEQSVGIARLRAEAVHERGRAVEGAEDWTPLDERRAPERNRARVVLAERGIAARPLFELLDLGPDLDPKANGRIERAILDAGLLDALVVRPDDEPRALAELSDDGLRDALLSWRTREAARVERRPDTLAALGLVVDPALGDGDWARIAESALDRLLLSDESVLRWHPDGTWRHGALAGVAGSDEPAELLGRARRRARRLDEIAALRQEEAGLRAEVGAREAERERQRAEQVALQVARRRLEGSATEARLEVAAQRLADQERALGEAREVLDRLVGRAREVDAERRAARDRLDDAAATFGRTAEEVAQDETLGQLSRGLAGAEQALALYRQTRRALRATWQRHQEARLRLADDRARLAEQEAMLQRAGERRARLAGAIQQLRALLDGAEYQSLLAELERLNLALRAAEESTRALETEIATDQGRLQAEQERIAEYEAQVDEARRVRDHADAALRDYLARLHSDAIDLARLDAEDGRLDLVVQRFAPDLDAIDEDELERAVTVARKEFGDSFNEHRARIKHVAPVPNLDDGRVVVETTSHGACSLSEYVGYLGDEIALQESLIEEKHERFYKEVLMRHAAREIREAIARADEWLTETGDLLRGLPFAQQRYSFVLKPNLQSSTALARVLDVFRKSEATFTDQDAERLRQALAEEAETLRRNFERGDQAEFRQMLDQLFDYRSWISVEVRVNGRPLTERAAQAASGGEQAFDFAVPLVVALAALYRNAAPFAPRLIAFDEAFMKASADNKGQMLRLLKYLDFQWVIASPDLPSRGVPAYAEYHLEYRQGDERAAMTPLFARTDAESPDVDLMGSNGHAESAELPSN